MDQQQQQQKEGFNQGPYQPEQSSYPHPQPPPAYDQSGTSHHNAHHVGHAPIYPSVHQLPVQAPTPVIVQTVYQPQVGPQPTTITCPSCRHSIVTRMDYETSTKTHIAAGLLCAFICWPCAWIPYVMDSCKNANHYCPNCGAFIGTYKD